MSTTDRLILSPALVGRAAEEAQVETALSTVRQGQGQVVLLAGEAGVGKSRLVMESRRRAEDDHFTILEGHCFEGDRDFPYAPLIDALRAFFAPGSAQETEEIVTDRLGALAAELVKLLPELSLTIPDLRPTPALDPEAEKRRLFEALLQFLSNLTQGEDAHPLLLILEDIHWADETSLDFLHLLARRIPACSILLLATYRREEVSPELTQLLVQLNRDRLAREIRLPPLTRSDMNAMLESIFDLDRPVRAEFSEAIYALTAGNPFFIEEVLKSLIAAGDIFYAEGEWDRKPMQELQIPRTVQDAVQRRTAQLSSQARRILTLAAVAGQRFDFALLQEVSGHDEQALLALIKELVAAQLVVEETAERFAFRHALTRHAVYAELLARERMALHRSVAAAIERVYADALDAHVAALSYHYYEAGEWTKVPGYARRAGERAQELYAPRASIEHFSRALAVVQHLEPAAPEAAHLASLYRGRGLAYEILGEFEQACADLEGALELVQAADAHESDAEEQQRAEWRALLDLGKLWASRDYARAGNYFQRALDLARRLDDPTTLARSLNRVGNWHVNIDEPREAQRCHQEALSIFQTLDDRRGLAQTFDMLGIANLLGGNLVQAAANFKRAIARWEILDDRQGLASSLATLSVCGACPRSDVVVAAEISFAECLDYSERAIRIAREIGWRAGEAYALILSSSGLAAQGQYGRALEWVERGMEIAQDIGHRQWISLALRYLGHLYLDLFALSAAQQHLEQGLALAKELGSTYHARMAAGRLVSSYLLEDNRARAQAILDADFTPEMPMHTAGQRQLWHARAELALDEDAEQALQIADWLLAADDNAEEHEVGAIPYVAQVRGAALTALQRWEEAEETLLAAQATAHTQNTPRLIWRIDVALGNLYQAQGRDADAARAFAHARQVVESMAASLSDLDLRENFLRRTESLIPKSATREAETDEAETSTQPSSKTQTSQEPTPVADQIPAGLTEREVEVLGLVAQGSTNREIAQTLHISVRTVDTHLTNILNKIGCENRTAAAAFALQHGLA